MALNEPRPDIPPKMVACLIDITEHCREDFVERCGGKVYLSGFYDDNLNTYLCSFEPCIYVEVIGLVPEEYPEDEPARTALFEETLEAHDPVEDSGYYTRSDIERRRKEHPEQFKDLGLTFDEDDDHMEDTREHLSGNPEF